MAISDVEGDIASVPAPRPMLLSISFMCGRRRGSAKFQALETRDDCNSGGYLVYYDYHQHGCCILAIYRVTRMITA